MSDPIDSTGESSTSQPSGKFEPVRLLLRRADGKEVEVETDERAMHDHSLIEHESMIFSYRGTEQVGGKWFRLYREAAIVQVRTMKRGTK